jgi:hypothetical protein
MMLVWFSLVLLHRFKAGYVRYCRSYRTVSDRRNRQATNQTGERLIRICGSAELISYSLARPNEGSLESLEFDDEDYRD